MYWCVESVESRWSVSLYAPATAANKRQRNSVDATPTRMAATSSDDALEGFPASGASEGAPTQRSSGTGPWGPTRRGMHPYSPGRRYVGIALALIFVLIGAAALVWTLAPHPVTGLGLPFGWGFGFFWVFVLMWLFFGLFSAPWRWRYRGWYGPYGYGGRRWSADP